MKILGIDYGEKRIGLALSDEIGIIASPIPTLKVKSISDAVSKIYRIAKRQNVNKIILGLPLNSKGDETKQSIQTRYFADSLKSTNGVDIEFRNEAYSTKQARKSIRKGSKKKNLDSEAARIILQEYLDSKNQQEKHNTFIPQYNDLLLK